MFKPFTPESDTGTETPWLLMVWLCAGLMGHASALAQNPSVADLIDRLKQKKEQEVLGTPAPKPDKANATRPSQRFQMPSPPMLWSISGINNELEAVLIYQGKAHVATSSKLPMRIGPWQVDSISAQGVIIHSLIKPADPPLEINAPASGAAIQAYATRLGVNQAPSGAGELMNLTGQPILVNAASSSAFSAQWTNNESAAVLFGTRPSPPPNSGPLPPKTIEGVTPPKP